MIRLQNLTVAAGEKILLDDVSLEIQKGEALGLTGQSGSGKTTILKSIMGILSGKCRIVSGGIFLDEERIDTLSAGKRRALAGTVIGFIPQNPMTAFDSRIKIGKQLTETYCRRLEISGKEAEALIADGLRSLNLSDVERIKRCFPAELSGGMLQRIAVAILLALEPDYILADEPTSALDEENTGILLRELKDQKKKTGILMVSHDTEVLKTLCGETCVMEQGRILEWGQTGQLFADPREEWTKRFVKAQHGAGNGGSDFQGGWEWKEL